MPITSFVLYVFIQLITDKIKENLTVGDKNSATNKFGCILKGVWAANQVL